VCSRSRNYNVFSTGEIMRFTKFINDFNVFPATGRLGVASSNLAAPTNVNDRLHRSGLQCLHPPRAAMAAFAMEGEGWPVLKRKLHGFRLLDTSHQRLRSADRALRNQVAGFGTDRQGIGNQCDIAPVDDEHAIAT